jgi:hypothetical protein
MRVPVSVVMAGSAALVAAGAAAAGPSLAATPAPQKTVTATAITRRTGTLKPGTAVTSKQLGIRTFLNGSYGVALAAGSQAQYPAVTTNGGRTWHTNGPALHVDAAQAPLTVLYEGVASRETSFAYGGGQVVDVTSNGGKTWRGALFDGLVMAVVPTFNGHLVAFIDGSNPGSGASGPTWQYVTKDGGHSWHYTTTIGGS